MNRLTIFLSTMFLLPTLAFAGEVDVTNVVFTQTGNNSYRFAVTLQHADTGWNHYADRWEILDSDGTVLATRVLAHPHVNEQPFTRSLSGVKIPDTLTQVEIRGHDSVHAYGGETFIVTFE